MNVLVSIQPPHTTNIFDKIKSIEWRTRQMPTGKQFVYETKNGGGIGKVVGECTIWRVHRYDNVSLIPEGHIDAGCVPYEFLEQYAKGKPLYAHFIVNAKRYDKPKDLIEFYGYCGEEPKCDGCKYLWVESNESVGYYEQCCSLCEGCKPLERPPQSWRWVEVTDNA
jgi:predicted transcriptional regulator